MKAQMADLMGQMAVTDSLSDSRLTLIIVLVIKRQGLRRPLEADKAAPAR